MTMRRDFILPEQDIEYLDQSGYPWETISDGPNKWVIIHGYPVPNGYNISAVKVALKIEGGYPVAQIDMVYFDPALNKVNGTGIGALVNQNVCGKAWQRWSRHRTAQNPWRPGLDDVSTHLQLVNYWLERELTK